MNPNDIGKRMKENYEFPFRNQLIRKVPVIIRVDGRAFHSFTRHLNKPFDDLFISVMQKTMESVANNIDGCVAAYTQSDEISFLVVDYQHLETEGWFGYKQSKLESITASLTTYFFNKLWSGDNMALFDARAFNIPKEEVVNYFLWRIRDWNRNSLSMFARKHFTQKDLHKKNGKDMHEMLHGKGENWADLSDHLKNGSMIVNGLAVPNLNVNYETLSNILNPVIYYVE